MKTIGVYKTDVADRSKAETIVNDIRRQFPGCEASFDLEDPDNVLRVENGMDGINEARIKKILQRYAHRIETLP